LLAGYLLAKRGGPGSAPLTPSQAPFPANAPLPPAPGPAPRGPIVLPEMLITPTPTGPAPALSPAPPVAAAVPKKRAVEVWRVSASNQSQSLDTMRRQFPAGWVPSHPPTSTEVSKARSLLPGWKKGGLNWDFSTPGTAGARAYWYREH
jgi:hypothetical protein